MASASSSKSEQSYIRSSLLANPPLRSDGRAPEDYRQIALETKVTPLANGSARVNIGGTSLNGVGGSLIGTEVLAAVKLEVETLDKVNDRGTKEIINDAGRILCNVSCPPSAYPNLSHAALDELQNDFTTILQESLSHASLRPKNLTILPGKKSWLLHLDLLVLSENGNIYDALFLAASAALRDTRVPKTRSIEYKTQGRGGSRAIDRMLGDDTKEQEQPSGFDTMAIKKATDFELIDHWDEGESLDCGSSWPVCVTLNLVPPIYFVDATPMEETAVTSRVLLLYTLKDTDMKVSGVRLLGSGEMDMKVIKSLFRNGEKHARELQNALDVYLSSQSNT